jgi:hypothetical protein
MSKDTGGAAFPQLEWRGDCHYDVKNGLTYLDYAAIKAMQEIIGFLPLMGLEEDKDAQVAKRSYEIARAMLAERDKP